MCRKAKNLEKSHTGKKWKEMDIFSHPKKKWKKNGYFWEMPKIEKMEKNGYFSKISNFFPFLAFPAENRKNWKKWIFSRNIHFFSISFPFLVFPEYPFFFYFFLGWEKISIFPTCTPKYLVFAISGPHHITFSCFSSLVFQKIQFPNKHVQEHHNDLLCFA